MIFPIFTPAYLAPLLPPHFCTYLGPSTAVATKKETLYISGLITLSHQSLWPFQSSVSVWCLLTYKTLSTWYNILWVSHWAQAVVVSGLIHKRSPLQREGNRSQWAAGVQITLRAIWAKVSLLVPKSLFKVKKLYIQIRKPQFDPLWVYGSVPPPIRQNTGQTEGRKRRKTYKNTT